MHLFPGKVEAGEAFYTLEIVPSKKVKIQPFSKVKITYEGREKGYMVSRLKNPAFNIRSYSEGAAIGEEIKVHHFKKGERETDWAIKITGTSPGKQVLPVSTLSRDNQCWEAQSPVQSSTHTTKGCRTGNEKDIIDFFLDLGQYSKGKFHLNVFGDRLTIQHSISEAIAEKERAAADRKARRPLVTAINKGDLEKAKELIAQGADVNEAGLATTGHNNGKPIDQLVTPLYAAVMHGYTEMIQSLIDAGAEVNRPSENLLPIHIVSYNELEIAKNILNMLLSAGADINARTKGAVRMAPVHFVAMGGNAGYAALLISLGADVNIETAFGQTPLALALNTKGIVENSPEMFPEGHAGKLQAVIDLLKRHGGHK